MSKGLNILQAAGSALSGKQPEKTRSAPTKPHGMDALDDAPNMSADHADMGQGEHFGIEALEKHVNDLHAMVQKLKLGTRGEHSGSGGGGGSSEE